MSRCQRIITWLGAQDGWWRWVVYSVAATVVWLNTLLVAFIVAASLAWQNAPRVIVSGSMEPALSVGDVLLVRDDKPTPGSIITYKHNGKLITHRVVKLRDGHYVTRGDANAADDSALVYNDQIVGVGKSVVPFVGWPRAALANLNYIGLAIWALILGGSTWMAWNWRSPQSTAHATADCKVGPASSGLIDTAPKG